MYTCSERLKREQALAEEKTDRKIELLTQSIKYNRKRRRISEEEDEDEMVSSVLLHAEQVKVTVSICICWHRTHLLILCWQKVFLIHIIVSFRVRIQGVKWLPCQEY